MKDNDFIDAINKLPIVNIKNRPDKDIYYLNIARDVSQRSTCLRRHYGAVIVNNDEIISTGYNGAPRGEENCCDKGSCIREAEGHAHNDGNYQSCPAVHAEANAIISAARRDMIGATLYLYGEDSNGCVIDAEPCPNCKGLIANSGIKNYICSSKKYGLGAEYINKE